MTKEERATRNKAIVRLAKKDVAVAKIAEAFQLSHQMVYNIINKAKQKEEADRLLVEARKVATRQWIDKTVRENKRSHVRITDVVRGLIAQVTKLYDGRDAVELIDYIETVVSNIYAYDYCRSRTISNYCTAKKDGARKERK